jgi:hypothetical protein
MVVQGETRTWTTGGKEFYESPVSRSLLHDY